MADDSAVDIGIIGAMPEETRILVEALQGAETIRSARQHYDVGTLEGVRVAITRAGIGKINAALCTQDMIDRFHPRGTVFTGVAGGILPISHIGDLVVSTHTVQHDYDISAFRGQRGFVPRPAPPSEGYLELISGVEAAFGREAMETLEGSLLIAADAQLRRLAGLAYDDLQNEGRRLPHLYFGVVASGDQFIDDPGARASIQREFGAICAEMEGAATGYTCSLNRTPFVVIRSLSDCADGSAPESFDEFCSTAAENSAALVLRMLRLRCKGIVEQAKSA